MLYVGAGSAYTKSERATQARGCSCTRSHTYTLPSFRHTRAHIHAKTSSSYTMGISTRAHPHTHIHERIKVPATRKNTDPISRVAKMRPSLDEVMSSNKLPRSTGVF